MGQPDYDDGHLKIDFTRREVTVAGAELRLAPRGYGLLRELVAARGAALEYRQILSRVWGPDYAGDERELVQAVARRLRSKIEPDPRRPRYILNVLGFGYRFKGSQAA